MTDSGRLTGREIWVAGGGVAGLAAARALALRGARVRLFEQAPAIAEVGAGIQISPNGFRVIEALGLGDALREVAVEAQGVVLRDGGTGRSVLRMPLEQASGPYLFVHRARLIEVLDSGARDVGVQINLGERLEPGAAPGLVLAADGIHSAHRPGRDDAPARFTGQVAWRAVIPDQEAPAVAQVFMAPGRHLVSYPLAGGLRNIVAVEEREAWSEEGWHHEDEPAALRAAFAGFGDPVPGWLDQAERVHLWGLFRHEVARRWYGAGYALLGDAAHPTLPFLAQGANMALEDAWVLAACLDGSPDDEALPIYQAKRRDRVVRIVEAASANARNYHLSGLRRSLAHAGLRLAGRLAPAAPLRRFDWLYGYDATLEH